MPDVDRRRSAGDSAARKPSHRLLRRLLIQHIVLFVALTVVVATPLLTRLNSTLVEQKLSLARYRVERLANSADDRIRAAQQIIESIYVSGQTSSIILDRLQGRSRGDAMADLEDDRMLQEFFRHAMRADPSIAGVALAFLPDGLWRVIDTESRSPGRWLPAADAMVLPDVVHARRYFQLIPTRMIVGADHEERPLFTIVTTLHDLDLNVVGGIAISFDANTLDAGAADADPEPIGTIEMVDRDGRLLYSSHGVYADREANGGTLPGSRAELVVSARSKEHGISVYNRIRSRELYGDTRNSVLVLAGLVTAVVAAALFLFYLTDRRLAGRIVRLLEAMEAVRNGSLDHRVPLDGREDEISRLYADFNLMCDELQRRIREEYTLQLRLRESDLMLLQSQVNPHFLYNTLEAFRVMADQNGNAQLSDMIQALARVSRDNIRRGQIWHPMAVEARYLHDMLGLYKMRYGDRLQYTIHADPVVSSYQIPRLLTQPIVENAVKYSVECNSDVTRVSVEFALSTDGVVRVTVADNGPGIPCDIVDALAAGSEPNGHGETDGPVGLTNVYSRLQAMFGSAGRLSIHSDGGGSAVEICFPATRSSVGSEHVRSSRR